MEYKRSIFNKLLIRLQEPTPHIQVLLGPRQVGKTTLARQICAYFSNNHLFVSADSPSLKGTAWIEEQWNLATLRAKGKSDFLLVIDEIQKIKNWSEIIKELYDKSIADNKHIKLLLLGSSQNLLSSGLGESLAGRFELIRVPHWSFLEIKEAFGLSIDQYIYFGGYPGSIKYIQDEDRFRAYVLDSLIEPTISKDILLNNRVDKPALLRLMFELGCQYSSKIFSYQKMLGQLQDAGNTTTLAHC